MPAIVLVGRAIVRCLPVECQQLPGGFLSRGEKTPHCSFPAANLIVGGKI
jgi:hypothetical protein